MAVVRRHQEELRQSAVWLSKRTRAGFYLDYNLQRVPQKSETSTWMALIMDVFKMRFLGDFRGNSESMNMAVRGVALTRHAF